MMSNFLLASSKQMIMKRRYVLKSAEIYLLDCDARIHNFIFINIWTQLTLYKKVTSSIVFDNEKNVFSCSAFT
jgi:hypothetical protein